MAFYTDTLSKDAGLMARGVASVSDWLGTFAEALVRRKIERTTYDELAALTNADLADLGIARAEIRRIAREAAQRGL